MMDRLSGWKNPEIKNTFLFFVIAYGLYCFPIIHANIYYRDDLYRALTQWSGWGWLGRPMADQVTKGVLFSEGHLPDATPLFLILSVVIIALTSTLVALTHTSRNSAHERIAILCAFMGPFFLQCLYYAYDVLPMTLAYCGAVLAWVLAEKRSLVRFASASMLLVAVMSLYQPGANAFLVMACVSLIIHSARLDYPSYALKGLFFKLAVYGVGVVVYMVAINARYNTTNRGEVVSLDIDGIWQVVDAIIRSYDTFFSFFTSGYANVIVPLLLLALIELGIIIFMLLRSDRPFKWLLAVMVLVVPFLVVPISMGPTIVIQDMYAAPRVMAASSVAISLVALGVLGFFERFGFLLRLKATLWLVPALLVVFSFLVGRTADVQREYEEKIVTMITTEVINSEAYPDAEHIYFNGHMPMSPIAKLTYDRYAMVERLVGPAESWMGKRILAASGVEKVVMAWDTDFAKVKHEMCAEGVEEVSGNPLYRIYSSDKDMLIEVGEKPFSC